MNNTTSWRGRGKTIGLGMKLIAKHNFKIRLEMEIEKEKLFRHKLIKTEKFPAFVGDFAFG
jgi:hypothetical protein